MGSSLFSSPFVHPQLQQIVAKMTLLDTLLFYVSFFFSTTLCLSVKGILELNYMWVCG